MKSEKHFASSGTVDQISPREHRIDGRLWIVGRMRVPGGWVVTTGIRGEATLPISSVFVADPTGTWLIGDVQ